MPANTTIHALPYMLDTDPLADVGLAIKNLADKVDKLLPRQGTNNVTVTASEAVKTVTVTFPQPFTAPPRVAPTVRGTSVWFAYVNSVSATQVVIGIRKFDGTGLGVAATIPVDWIAVATA